MNERTAAIVPFRCVITKHARCVWAFCNNCGPIYQSYDGFSSIDALRFTLTDGNLTDNRTLTSKRGLDGLLRITFWAKPTRGIRMIPKSIKLTNQNTCMLICWRGQCFLVFALMFYRILSQRFTPTLISCLSYQKIRFYTKMCSISRL